MWAASKFGILLDVQCIGIFTLNHHNTQCKVQSLLPCHEDNVFDHVQKNSYFLLKQMKPFRLCFHDCMCPFVVAMVNRLFTFRLISKSLSLPSQTGTATIFISFEKTKRHIILKKTSDAYHCWLLLVSQKLDGSKICVVKHTNSFKLCMRIEHGDLLFKTHWLTC